MNLRNLFKCRLTSFHNHTCSNIYRTHFKNFMLTLRLRILEKQFSYLKSEKTFETLQLTLLVIFYVI